MRADTEIDTSWLRTFLPTEDGRAAALGKPPRGFASLAGLQLEPEKKLPIAYPIKLWYGLSLFLEGVHASGVMLVRDHSAAWLLKVPSKRESDARSRSGGLTADAGMSVVTDLPGECQLATDPDHPTYPLGEALPDEFAVTRYSAPEARRGATVGPSADVYMAARVVLDMFTGRPVAVAHEDALHVLALFRLFHADFPVGVLAFLERCLATNPGDRPATAQEAREELAAVVAAELKDLSAAWRPFARLGDIDELDFTCYRRLALAARKEEEARNTFQDVTLLHDDDLTFRLLDHNLVLAGVFDGVSRTDIGSGGFAAQFAKERLVRHLETEIKKHRGKRGEWIDPAAPPPERYSWLQKMLTRAIRKAHESLVKAVRVRYADELAPRLSTPLTTATVALIHGDHAVVAWVGDSPAYLVNAAGAARLTAAETVENMTLVESGVESALTVSSPDALTGTLGSLNATGNDLVLRVARVRLRESDLLVLGTDGVLAHLRDGEPECRAFVAAAGQRARSSGAEGGPAAALFDELWEESARRGSRDDRTLVVFAAAFAQAGDPACLD